MASDEFVVNVAIKNADDLFGAAFRVIYDNEKIKVINVEAGGFLGETTEKENATIGQTVFMYAVDTTDHLYNDPLYKGLKGVILIGYTKLGKESGGVSGDGILAKIKFKILVKGETKLSFEKVDFRHSDLSFIQVRTKSLILKIE